MSIMMVPSGSRWARGFRVRRPWALGVGSPSLSAAKAWAASWMVMAINRETAQTRKNRGLLNRYSIIIVIVADLDWFVVQYPPCKYDITAVTFAVKGFNMGTRFLMQKTEPRSSGYPTCTTQKFWWVILR